MSKKFSLHQNSVDRVWGTYTQHSFHMTATSVFDLMQLMKSNRFFHTDSPSLFPVTWQRTTGEKSFINPHLTPINWLQTRQQWSLSSNPNPDIVDFDTDLFLMSAHTTYEKEESFFKIGLPQNFPLTRNLAPPFWLQNLDAGGCVVRIRNLPEAVPADIMRTKLCGLFSRAGHVLGYAAYYLPANSFRNCEFVLIGFADCVAAKRAESGHCYLYDHHFLTVELVDLSFCSTFQNSDGLYLSVYA
eukprot:gene23398-31741_t